MRTITMCRIFPLILLVGAMGKAQTNPLAGDAQAAETGRWTFRILCGPCHGIHADGGRGPDLTRGAYTVGDEDRNLYNAIARGIPGSEMPPYGDRLDADAIWRLVSYIRSAAAAKQNNDANDAAAAAVKGANPAAGQATFWGKGNCGQCHRVASKGSGIGPDLTRVGRQRSLKYLRSAIVTPDAEITPGYATIQVVLKNGKTVNGIERGLDNFSTQFIDLSGKYHSYVREDVTSMARQPRSLMPSYQKLFNESELNDLLAYLTTLRGATK